MILGRGFSATEAGGVCGQDRAQDVMLLLSVTSQTSVWKLGPRDSPGVAGVYVIGHMSQV